MFSGQLAQLVAKINFRGSQFYSAVSVPISEPATQICRQEMIDGFVDSGRVRSFEHLKKIVDGDQRANLAHFIRKTGNEREVARIAFLQLQVRKIHDSKPPAPLRFGFSVAFAASLLKGSVGGVPAKAARGSGVPQMPQIFLLGSWMASLQFGQ
jgi:hypothetical protein